MALKRGAFIALFIAAVACPHSVSAMGAGAGCADLPEYYRAVGALEGMPGACDMSVEQARRIVAAEQGGQQQSSAPAAPVRHRRHRRVTPSRRGD